MSKAGVIGVLIFLVIIAIIAIWVVSEQQHSASLIKQGCEVKAFNQFGQPTLWTCPSNVDPGLGFVPGFIVHSVLAIEEKEEEAKKEEENCCAYADPIKPKEELKEEPESEESEEPTLPHTDPIRPKEETKEESENTTNTNSTQLDYCWKVNKQQTAMIVTECP